MLVLHDCLKSLCNIPVVIISLVNALSTHAQEQIVKEPSRAGNYLIFCPSFLLHDDVMCLQPFSTSNHCMQSLYLFVELAQSKQRSNTFFRDFSNADYFSFDNWLSSIDWNLVLQSGDNVEESWNTFLQFIETGITQFVPIKENKILIKNLIQNIQHTLKNYKLRKSFYGKNGFMAIIVMITKRPVLIVKMPLKNFTPEKSPT